MKVRWTIIVGLVGTIFCFGTLACRLTVTPSTTPAIATQQTPSRVPAVRTDIGFRTHHHLEAHYQKHGREFDSISQDEYLRQAQTLRDSPAGGDILEAVRRDGVTTRFDRQAGSFLAFDKDLTIRTFFRPNDGERYFKRQLNRKQ